MHQYDEQRERHLRIIGGIFAIGQLITMLLSMLSGGCAHSDRVHVQPGADRRPPMHLYAGDELGEQLAADRDH